MNSTVGKAVPIVNIRAIVTELLLQWKAILIVALLMALIVPGLKYSRDMKSYNDECAKQEESKDEKSADEKVEDILAALSASDRSDVEYVIEEKDWVRKQREYLNKSILMNTNPTNQRTLLFEYKVSSPESGNMTALMYSYLGRLDSKDMLKQLGAIIDPDADIRYIAELISYDLDRFTNIESDVKDMVLEFRLVIPEDIDAAAVEQAVTACLSEYSDVLEKTIGSNQISYLTALEFVRYNGEAVNNRTNINYSINNVQNNIKNGTSTYSDQAKAAIEAIDAVKTAEYEMENIENIEEIEEENAPVHPGFRKKYAALGFLLGILIYAFIYTFRVIVKGNITSAADMRTYTAGRLLGEVYSETEYKGIAWLLHSKLVDKFIYKGKLDVEKQIDKIASSLEAVSVHSGVDKIKFICIPDFFSESGNTLKMITAAAKERNIDSQIIKTSDELDETELISVDNCVLVAGCGSKAASVVNLAGLCREYGIKHLGNIYIREI